MRKTWLNIKETSSAQQNAQNVSPRALQKRSQILEVAQEQFLRHGFAGASIDSIVEIVGGSKSTIYSYFGNKESLFAAVIRSAGHASDKSDFPVQSDNIRDDLIAFAEDRLAHVLSPLNIGLMQIVVAEATRLPQIAELYYCNAPVPTYRELKAYLDAAVRDRKLDIDDIEIATQQFIGTLLQFELLGRLFGIEKPPKAKKIRDKAIRVVDGFLLNYAP